MMLHTLYRHILCTFGCLISINLAAGTPGYLLNISASGDEGNVTLEACLNAADPLKPLSCQVRHISGGYTLAVSIPASTPATCYNNIGFKVLEPADYKVAQYPESRVGDFYLLPQICSGQTLPVVITLIDPDTPAATKQCHGSNGQCRVYASQRSTCGNMQASRGVPQCTGTGIANANCLCNYESNKPVGKGTYAAWLSDANTSALSNIRFNSSYTYVATTNNNAIISTSPTSFPASLVNAISAASPFANPYTGTNSSGVSSGNNCNSWTICSHDVNATYGDRTATNSSWTDNITFHCNSSQTIYCFEIPTK